MATLNEEIGKLIARRLLADEAITLPEVGALHTKRIAARRLSATQLQPPHRVVLLSDSPMGHSLIEEILREAHCSEEQAADAYARWRTKATDEGRLVIEGVGTLCLKSFTPTEEFERRLNPQGKSPIRVKRRPMPWWAWSMITLTLIFLLFGALALVVNPLELYERWSGPEKGAQVEPSSETEHSEKATGNTAAAAATQSSTEATEHAVAPAPSAEGATDQVAAQTTKNPSTEVTPKPTSGGSTTIQPTVSGMSYVVMGIYSTEQNAHRAIEQAVKRYAIPQGDFSLFRYGEKWLVSLGECEKRADAQAIARRYRTEHKTEEVWVYSKR